MDKKNILVGLIALIIGILLGVMFANAERASAPSVVEVGRKTAAEELGWETYYDHENGFEIKYPQTWVQSIHGVSLVLQISVDATTSLSVESLESYQGKKFEEIYDGKNERMVDFPKDCKSIVFAETNAFDCPFGSFLGMHAVFVYGKKYPLVINDNIDNYLSRQILSTFKTIK